MNNWISVKDRLPEKSGYYLTKCDYRPYRPIISYFDIADKSFYDSGVTHWMDIPEN